MLYWEDLKVYIVGIIIFIFVIFISVFIYKWQTRALTNKYCGTFNNFYCDSGVCDYKKSYGEITVGYCRNKFISF